MKLSYPSLLNKNTPRNLITTTKGKPIITKTHDRVKHSKQQKEKDSRLVTKTLELSKFM